MSYRFVLPCFVAIAVPASALAGELVPPAGPVAETGRFGPRVEINLINTPGDADSLYKITEPGSYYLGGNLNGAANKHGIEIASSGVTVDLMGFDVKGFVPPPMLAGASLDGITVSISTAKNVRIYNGSIREWGGDGVHATQVTNCLLSDLNAENNKGTGLYGGINAIIKGCAATTNGDIGIRAGFGSTISDCAANFNTGGDGIRSSFGCTVIGNSAMGNAANGIYVERGSLVSGNAVRGNSLDGIFANSGCLITTNMAWGNLSDGIEVVFNCYVFGNSCGSNGFMNGDGAGIHVINTYNHIEANNVVANDRGIDVDLSGNLIIRNSASTNTIHYDIVADNRYGPIIDLTAPGTAAVLGSSAGSTVITTDPWANFSY